MGNRKKNIILGKLRNKASNLNENLTKVLLIDESRCLYCGSESEGNMIFFSWMSKIHLTKRRAF